MPRNPSNFLHFVANNYPWLASISERREGFYSDDDIAASLRPFVEDTNPARRISEAKRLGVLSQATGEWSVPLFLTRFIRDLDHRFAMASPVVIRSWIEKLDGHAQELAQLAETLAIAPSGVEGDELAYILRETADTFQSIAASISDNCARISIEVAEYRAASEVPALRSRLRRLIKLFEQYLEPILRIIDITGEFAAVTDRVALSCARIQAHQEKLDDAFVRQLRDIRRDITWMRRIVLRQAGEANRELAPLCQTAIRESRIAVGVNRALEAARHGRYGCLALERLGIVEHRDESLVSDSGIEDYVRTMLTYEPAPPPRIGVFTPDELSAPWTATRVTELLDDEAHVPDILDWIMEHCAPLRAEQAARLLRGVIDLRPEEVHVSGTLASYRFSEVELTSMRWQWRTPNGAHSIRPDAGLVAKAS